ncbi:glutamine synthetase family protein [Rhodococcus qingshengii]|uniref:Glutamine synthetase family protein n=1 Tax=Rhodococcus qingshengii TaxID=334542 RepID=A0AAW6M0E2_RHOSG|nr:glutamine synthetase family protein [Rhodococcus qingshengii]MDE8649910.1 glutamine synthetase family protein [Rhodococcus qingshengii]
MADLMSVDELRSAVADDSIDTVILAMPDMQGRLQGKRLDAGHFLADIINGGLHTCSYLITRDVDMVIHDGYDFADSSSGMGDFVLEPDMNTLRPMPWVPGTVLVLANTAWEDGRPVVQAPREILRRQLERLRERGWTALVATELEFLLFEQSYQDAQSTDYHRLTPASYYDADYSIFGTAKMEPLLRQIRRAMRDAGMPVEGVTGEVNHGQFELGFKYDKAMNTCDNHVLYKEGVKEIAMNNGVAATFMAKFNEGAGNSCHVHLSLVDDEGCPVFADQSRENGYSEIFEHFLAGQLAAANDLSLMVAPNINSYKRYQEGTFAPTALQWGRDNRTCAVRVIGEGRSLRLENRTPGGDVNPYLAVAAIIAAGLHGIDEQLALPPEATGNAYGIGGERMPTSLRDAITLWDSSVVAEKAFGSDVVRHYSNAATNEVATYEGAVTDWERRRGFERM